MNLIGLRWLDKVLLKGVPLKKYQLNQYAFNSNLLNIGNKNIYVVNIYLELITELMANSYLVFLSDRLYEIE